MAWTSPDGPVLRSPERSGRRSGGTAGHNTTRALAGGTRGHLNSTPAAIGPATVNALRNAVDTADSNAFPKDAAQIHPQFLVPST